MNPNPILIAPIFPLWLIILLLAPRFGGGHLPVPADPEKAGSQQGAWPLPASAGGHLPAHFFCPESLAELEGREHEVSPAVAILVDTSQSMGLSGHAGKGSRLDEAKSLLNGGANPLVKVSGGRDLS